MYVPHLNQMGPEEEIARFVQANSFGVLVSNMDGVPYATHLPLLYSPAEDGQPANLRGHFAKSNPQWEQIDGAEVLAIFSGAHGYISPSWYFQEREVPTWNYLAAHVYGRCRIMTDFEKIMAHLTEIVRVYEPDSPLLPILGDDDFRAMAGGVVAFEIEISRMEGKAKLSQNKTRETIQSVIDHLDKRGQTLDADLADAMREALAHHR